MTCEPDVSVWSELEPGLFFLRMESADDERGVSSCSLYNMFCVYHCRGNDT